MFDEVPARAWLLLAIAAAAYAPARYTFQYIAASPARRDITQPPEDLTWRRPAQLARSVGILCALIALAIFVFTPAAEQFAQSPRFLPVISACIGAWSVFTVPRGLATGQIEPLVKGFYNTYYREGQPKRFWASLSWNAFLGCFCLWVAYETNLDSAKQSLRDQCYDEKNAYPPRVEIAACNRLIADTDSSRNNISDLVRSRGYAYYRLGDLHGAYSDFNEAIRLNPRDSHAYLNRGLILLDLGAFDEAISDLNRAHKLDPKDPWAIANRGLALAWKKDEARAKQDFQAVRAIDPTNPVMLRGEALLLLNAGDVRGAVNRLTASLGRDPDNLWALRTRAELYWELGEEEKSAADDEKWRQLKEKARSTGG